MTAATVIIQNRSGIHARPSSMLAQTALKFKSEVYLAKGSEKINAKSIMGILTLGASFGTSIEVSADGPDEEEAVLAMTKLINSRFDLEDS